MHLIKSAAESVSPIRVAKIESGPRVANAIRLKYMLNNEKEKEKKKMANVTASDNQT
jgi:hypothetical protein